LAVSITQSCSWKSVHCLSQPVGVLQAAELSQLSIPSQLWLPVGHDAHLLPSQYLLSLPQLLTVFGSHPQGLALSQSSSPSQLKPDGQGEQVPLLQYWLVLPQSLTVVGLQLQGLALSQSLTPSQL
jgi:hypothetical protein